MLWLSETPADRRARGVREGERSEERGETASGREGERAMGSDERAERRGTEGTEKHRRRKREEKTEGRHRRSEEEQEEEVVLPQTPWRLTEPQRSLKAVYIALNA
jgi:hypothetical protein